MVKRVFPKYSPYYYLVDSKKVRMEVAPINATECINQDDAASIFFKDEVTGFPVDVLRDVVNGENVTSPLLKPHKGSYPPSGLSDAEIMALAERAGVDTLVEKEKYLSFVDSQVVFNDNYSTPEPTPEPTSEPTLEPTLEPTPEPSK